MRFQFFSLMAAIALAGCAQSAGDACGDANRSVSFGALLSNSTSGAYGTCLDDMRAELAATRLRAGALRQQAAELRAEQGRLRGERAAAAGRLAALNERQAQRAARLANASPTEQDRLAQALRRERQLSEELARLNRQRGVSEAQARQIAEREAQLDADLDVMLR